MTTSTCTTCPYCGVGCGVTVSVDSSGAVSVAGDQNHPANRGKLCLKGLSLPETLSLEGRLLHPMVDGQQSSWDTALTRIAKQFKYCIDHYGPESVAFYVSGQLLTEDYYVVNKLVKGFIGTANIDTNSRLCMASSVAGHKRAFGADTVPGCYEDIEQSDLVVLVGSNLAWCHPVLHGRLTAAKQDNPSLQVVTVDTRDTATSELADSHLRIKPDSDTALFNGLLKWLYDHDYADNSYVEAHTTGLDGALSVANAMDIETVATLTGLKPKEIHSFYQSYAQTRKVVTVYSQGVNQSSGGTDKVNAIINCHLLTGRIGTQGCGPFSITGQPNAMGGRETGGLANMLTCHMDLENESHRETVQQFWNSPQLASKPGLKAVNLFKAVGNKKVRALWIMATNPVASMPDAESVARALQQCDFVVQSDVVMDNDTATYAHVRLPAHAWGEKDGTVTNSERCISRQRRFMTPPGESQPDWWSVAQVAARLGHTDAFNYSGPDEIFTEYATLSGIDNHGKRDFNISAYADIEPEQYTHMKPFYWPANNTTSTPQKPVRFFADGGFFTRSKKANFIATEVMPDTTNGKILNRTDGTLHLNTGRVRDQWHTMTRTGTSHSLSSHTAEPYVEIHPENADEAGLENADLAMIYNSRGSVKARVVITERVSTGSIFVPIHWCRPFSNAGRIDVLIDAETDPVSGQPALKHSVANIRKIEILNYGFAITRHPLTCDSFTYLTKAICEGGWRTEFASDEKIDLHQIVTQQINKDENLTADNTEQLEYIDPECGNHRLAVFHNSSIVAACFTSEEPVSASRDWLVSALTKEHDAHSRHSLLAATAPANAIDAGRKVCTCFGVSEEQILQTITENECQSVDAVGKLTQAGTNCGSCRSDISALLKARDLSRNNPVQTVKQTETA